jgi:hypothetical protein
VNRDFFGFVGNRFDLLFSAVVDRSVALVDSELLDRKDFAPVLEGENSVTIDNSGLFSSEFDLRSGTGMEIALRMGHALHSSPLER